MVTCKTSELIDVIVKRIVFELKQTGMIEPSKMNTFKKTEMLLFEYPKMNPTTLEGIEMMERIKTALDSIKDDPYYELIELRYFKGMTYEQLCEYYDVERNTIVHHRTRLINRIKAYIIPDDCIKEIKEL